MSPGPGPLLLSLPNAAHARARKGGPERIRTGSAAIPRCRRDRRGRTVSKARGAPLGKGRRMQPTAAPRAPPHARDRRCCSQKTLTSITLVTRNVVATREPDGGGPDTAQTVGWRGRGRHSAPVKKINPPSEETCRIPHRSLTASSPPRQDALLPAPSGCFRMRGQPSLRTILGRSTCLRKRHTRAPSRSKASTVNRGQAP